MKPTLLNLDDVRRVLYRATPATTLKDTTSMISRMFLEGRLKAINDVNELLEDEVMSAWKSSNKEKPRVEMEVLAIVPHFTYLTIFYEDGNVKYEDSDMEWVDDFGEEYIPEGWYMRVPVDDNYYDGYNVIKIPDASVWMPLPLPRNVGDFE